MSVPGYRGTSPPMVFLDFSREPLEEIEGGVFKNYEDPFDLRGTLKEFRYTLTKGDVPGAASITLINPNQQVEDRLFSWFAAMAPRSWRAKQTETKESWADRATNHAVVYLRWGYMSQGQVALSHIHEMVIFDVGYEVSDKQDRLVTLQLQTQHDIGIIREEVYSSKGQTVTTTADIGISDDGVIQEPASILEDILGKLGAGDGTASFVLFSDEQKQILNAAFDEVGTRKSSISYDANFLESREYLEDTGFSKYGAQDCLRRFFNGIGLDISFERSLPSPLVPAQSKISLSQLPGTYAARRSQSAPQDYTNAAKGNAKVQRIKLDDVYIPFTDDEGVEGVLTSVYLVNPYRLTSRRVAGSLNRRYSSQFSYTDVIQALEKDEIYLLPGDSSVNNITDNRLAEGLFGQLRYFPSDYPQITTALELARDKLGGQLREVDDGIAPDDIQLQLEQDKQELSGVNLLQPLPVVPINDLLGVTNRIGTVSCTTSSRSTRLKELLEKVNQTYLNTTGEYIETYFLPTSVVPVDDRDDFESKLGAKVNWEKSKGILLIGSLALINEFTRPLVEINSFDIQVSDSPEKIILSTGFSKNKTNIVTDVSYRQTKAGFFFEFYRSPVILEQVYDIAQRFEDPVYRDAITRTFILEADKKGDVKELSIIEKEVVPVGDKEFTSLDEQTNTLFTEQALDKVFAAAARSITDNDYTEDSALGTSASIPSSEEIEGQRIKEKFLEDLQFLKANSLIDVFFPQASELYSNDKLEVFVKIGTRKHRILEDTRPRRYIAPSPLSLIKKNDDGSFSPGTAITLSSKLKSLQDFRKRILNIRVRTLGIPEMDVLAYEIGQRKIGLMVTEPREPGTYHWLTGVYYPIDITHKISPSEGYVTEMELLVSESNTDEEVLGMSFAFLEKEDD